MDIRWRPLVWDEPRTPARLLRPKRTFSKSWTQIQELLRRELSRVKATEAVVELDVTEGAIRQDGQLRAGAGPGFQGVKVSFNLPEVGRVEYATDKHEFWQHNIYAIALGLEALRAVDRYGITTGRQQYTGFRAIGNGKMTRAEAARFIVRHANWNAAAETAVLRDPQVAEQGYRIAAKRLHPDQGGSAEEFQRLQQARGLLQTREAVTA